MPFFLATASPSFSALTICCGLAGATGATNAEVLESITSGRRNRARIASKAGRGLSVSPEVFNSRLLRLERTPLPRKGCESVLASVLLDASSTFPQFLLHALIHTRWQSTIREQFAEASLIPLLQNFVTPDVTQRAQATN